MVLASQPGGEWMRQVDLLVWRGCEGLSDNPQLPDSIIPFKKLMSNWEKEFLWLRRMQKVTMGTSMRRATPPFPIVKYLSQSKPSTQSSLTRDLLTVPGGPGLPLSDRCPDAD